MTDKTNIHAIPNSERDKTQAAMDTIARFMPQQAALAKAMMDEYVVAGFTKDEALKLVAYSIFK
jgi:uncharacterized protein YciI